MKKQSRGIFFLWALIIAVAAGGTFLICRHLGVGVAPAAQPMAEQDTQPGTDASPDISVSAPAGAAVPMQKFSNDGYALNVPASWNIEKTGSDTIALHGDASSSAAACKIEMSAFPYAAGADGIADWISHRIGADPSLSVVEQSSGDVAITGGAGVRWTGTINDIPTTFVYAFNAQHAYEIAPSAIGEGADGAPQCNEMLQTLLSGLTI